jgi:hypothetical protein
MKRSRASMAMSTSTASADALKQARLQKNRESARECRRRKKMEVDRLKARVAELEDEIQVRNGIAKSLGVVCVCVCANVPD